ncbi:MAG TPA: TIGR03617 family F420-dependent LLM class oxidoreductase [Polyangiaceae bacterium]|nr:TIGR03617 family F420-dependent LLM class oxidoreductase [Polyangiaceae bacterium]
MTARMKFDGALLTSDLAQVPALARELATAGYDGAFSFEGPHEPFLPLLLAAEHAPSLEISTGLAIALARNPMVVANLAYDLHAYAQGRFILGLGSQIRPHIERRYSSTWERPLARMREFVLALKAIFACWNDGDTLDFRGEFYTHTLMPPLFHPGPNPHGRPPIMLGAVGAKATEIAAEVADAMLVHPFHSVASLKTITLPAVERGLQRAGRAPSDFFLACQSLVVTGADDNEIDAARAATRSQIAFYASTPSYRVVLDAEGWGELQPELQAMTRRGQWAEMTAAITDAMLERFAVVGSPEQVGELLCQRYGAMARRIAFASPYPVSSDCARRIFSAYRAAAQRGHA